MADFGIGGHHKPQGRTNVWLTPPDLLASLGAFDLDPCAATDRPWDTAKVHLTVDDDGLAHEWSGRVWLNPPYARDQIGAWLRRMAGHGTGTALIFARTETEVFHRFVWEACDGLLFLEGRLHFHNTKGIRSKKNSGAPSVLCAYGSLDADILASSDLPGAFVPLRLRAMTFGFETVGTWAEEVHRVMADRSGEPITLADLYHALANSPKAKRNRNYQAKIRQTLQRGPFEPVERGVWTLPLEGGANA